jgi:hypothetical protein
MVARLYETILLDIITCNVYTGYNIRRIRRILLKLVRGSQNCFQELYNEVDHSQQKPNLVHILIESIIWPLKELHP